MFRISEDYDDQSEAIAMTKMKGWELSYCFYTKAEVMKKWSIHVSAKLVLTIKTTSPWTT